MTQKIRESIKCPVIKWLFDDLPHLFFHDGINSVPTAFGKGDIVLCYTSLLAQKIRNDYPSIAKDVHFLPHATDTSLFKKINWNPKYDISFVGSFLNIDFFIRTLFYTTPDEESLVQALYDCVEKLKADYDCDFKALVEQHNLGAFLTRHKLDWLHLKRILSDLISTQDRVSCLTELGDLDLKIFGGKDWVHPLSFYPDMLKDYQLNAVINTQEKLTEVYQSSKISVDIPNIQNRNSLSGRVMDVMASGSLLITKYQKDSDAFRLFGSDCPIPMYKDQTHLRELCDYYLKNESERLEIVKKCNELVHRASSFEERIFFVLSLIQKKPAPSIEGSIEFVETSLFVVDPKIKETRERLKLFVRSVLKFLIPRPVRHKIVNLLLPTLLS